MTRLLVIDPTRVGGHSATGQVKRNLLIGWPPDAFLQVSALKEDRYPLAVGRSLDDPSTDSLLSADREILEAVASFSPEIIYYRPRIDSHPNLHTLALEILARHPVPLVTHVMDDWPRRLEAEDETRGRAVNQALRELLWRSDKALSISEKMSAALGDRYGVTFEAVANGVDPDAYRAAAAAAKLAKRGRKELVVRYCGALARDMTFQTLVDVARAVDALRGEVPMRLEVYTMRHWRRPFEEATAGLGGITISDEYTDDFPSRLAEADVLVLAYNFDQDSIRYIGLSMPNKVPEYLASGVPVLAVGPREANGIDYVLSRGLACCVTDRDPEKLAAALRRLGTDPGSRDELAAKAQAWAFEHLDLTRISSRFQTILRETAAQRAKRMPLLGPYSRDQKAWIDEADVSARLLTPLERGGVVVDVGAHQGSSVKRLADAGWTVVACEPDSHNRAMLMKHLGGRSNVSVDPRAVSDQPAQEATLFSSAQSSGISSLHAFHQTHRAAETVQVTTVAELVDAYGLPKIDLLKIDVEGLDWNVLKGVPWDRVRPEVIECEFEDAKTLALGHTHREIADDLVGRGYTVYLSEWHPIVRYGVRHDWRQLVRYPMPLGSSDAWGNILALREDPGYNAVSTAFEVCLTVENPGAVEGDGHEPAVAAGLGGADGSQGEGDDGGAVTPKGLSRYERIHLWASTRNPAILFVGRLVMWCGRKARRYPAWSAAYLVLLAGLVTAALLSEGAALWAAAAILAAMGALVVVTGFNRFLIKDARHELELKHLSLKRRLEGSESSLRAEQQNVRGALEALRSEREAATDALEAKIVELLSAQEQAREALLAEIGGLRSDKEVVANLATEVDSLRSETSAISERALSFDIVSALRQLHPLWEGRNGADRSEIAEETEHGHAVLMALLVEEERKAPGVVRGKTLIEIGSTRERDPRQGSTEKLAIFTGMMDMRFVTVDVDPINTQRARRVIDLLNPGAKAVTKRARTTSPHARTPSTTYTSTRSTSTTASTPLSGMPATAKC